VFFPFFSFNGHSVAQMQSHMADADSRAIKQSVAAFSDAWNRHDSHAVAMRYVEDGDFSSTQGIRATAQRKLRSTMFPSSELPEERAQDGHREEYSVSDSVDRTSGYRLANDRSENADGADARRVKACSTGDDQANGEWMITVYHESLFTPPPAK